MRDLNGSGKLLGDPILPLPDLKEACETLRGIKGSFVPLRYKKGTLYNPDILYVPLTDLQVHLVCP